MRYTLCFLAALTTSVFAAPAPLLTATWQSSSYVYRGTMYYYYYYTLQTLSGSINAGNYTFTCTLQGPTLPTCQTQLITIPNWQNAIQQCLTTTAKASQNCLLFSPCQNNTRCNTTYYQSSSCQNVTFQNSFSGPWSIVGRFYYLLPNGSPLPNANLLPTISCRYLAAS